MGFTDDAGAHAERPAIADARGTHSHGDLDASASRVASGLLGDRVDLREARVALLISPGFEFVASMMGIWRAGGVAVPLSVADPPGALDYILRDAGVETIVAGPSFANAVASVAANAAVSIRTTEDVLRAPPRPLALAAPERRALMVYSSGTTARPKGVVSTHANVRAQIASLTEAWEWVSADRTLLVLPLHHIHGLINVVGSALSAGACCEMPARFDAAATWHRLASGEITVFSAVPAIYHRLVAQWEAAPEGIRGTWSAGSRQARLMMSGSAALPTSMLRRWEEITGQRLLERYGLTEAGMVLSNPLRGDRRPGFVGTPLPGVVVRLVDEAGQLVSDGSAGEVEVRGPGVFREYWGRDDLTREAFRDGWFRTGDVAVFEDGSYRLLGRSNVDILKSGGYKISALEIEDAIRQHPAVADCAVVGVPDPEWGDRVCAALELRPNASLAADELREWLRPRLSPYKIPKDTRVTPALPRNAMGKVVKPQVAGWFAVHGP